MSFCVSRAEIFVTTEATHPESQIRPDRPPWLRWFPVWLRNLRVWTKLAGPSMLGNFGEPLLYLLALGYGLGSFIETMDGMPYLVYLASGIVCSSAMMTASFEAMYSAYTRMAVQQTWDGILATPLEERDVVLGEALWAATKSLVNGSAILVVAAALGTVKGWLALWVLPVVLLTGLCFGALALVVTAIARSYEFFPYYNTLLLTPMLLMSGVFFPLERMPSLVQSGAELLPLVHAVRVVRPLMTGAPLEHLVLHLSVLAAYSALGLCLAAYLVRRRLRV